MTTAANLDEYVYKAKLAEQAERFEEMVECMKLVAQKKPTELTVEERNLLSVAYKNAVGARRGSWRVVYTLEAKENQKSDALTDEGKADEAAKHQTQAKYCREYRSKIEKELTDVCKDILLILNNFLIPRADPDLAQALSTVIANAHKHKDKNVENVERDLQAQLSDLDQKSHLISKVSNGESLVFYFKMVGDYHRYLAEFNVESEADRVQAMTNSLASYFVASEIARIHLPPTHPIRLGLALNFSVFHYEIMSQPAHACKLATQAFDEAMAELDQLHEDSYKDSTLIMQLLRDNLTLWHADMNDSAQPNTQSQYKFQAPDN